MKIQQLIKNKVSKVVGEFLLIVIGVIVALWADTWLKNQELISQESLYIEQLYKDTLKNEQNLLSAIRQEEMQHAAKEEILLSLMSGEIIAKETAHNLLIKRRGAFNYSDPRLIEGTLSSLIQSGDISIIRDITLRTELMGYFNKLQRDFSEFNRWVSYELNYISMFDEQISTIQPSITEINLVDIFVLVQGEPKTLEAFRGAIRASRNRLTYMRRMLEDTETIKERISL